MPIINQTSHFTGFRDHFFFFFIVEIFYLDPNKDRRDKDIDVTGCESADWLSASPDERVSFEIGSYNFHTACVHQVLNPSLHTCIDHIHSTWEIERESETVKGRVHPFLKHFTPKVVRWFPHLTVLAVHTTCYMLATDITFGLSVLSAHLTYYYRQLSAVIPLHLCTPDPRCFLVMSEAIYRAHLHFFFCLE